MLDWFDSNEKPKYMTADEARNAVETGAVNRNNEQTAFREISDEEFENTVRKYVYRCLERDIPMSAKSGYSSVCILPVSYNTADDDWDRIFRAHQIIKGIVEEYGYTVERFNESDVIHIIWE